MFAPNAIAVPSDEVTLVAILVVAFSTAFDEVPLLLWMLFLLILEVASNCLVCWHFSMIKDDDSDDNDVLLLSSSSSSS